MEEFFMTPSQEDIDRQWLTQLCYDGQMADDEIEEFVDAVIQWKNKAIQCALSDVVDSEAECCEEPKGFYLGTTCPKCSKPFRSVNKD
jgi:deoxycytidine triphosphate deaminase